MGAFSILATVLAIMGLFGIALISITRKTKEIGLRKVNGASISEVLFLLNKDFVRWVFVSLIIGIPVSYYAMSSLAKPFRIQDRIKLVDLCYCRCFSNSCCSFNSELAELEGSNRQPGGSSPI